jgi:hypothetical protein
MIVSTAHMDVGRSQDRPLRIFPASRVAAIPPFRGVLACNDDECWPARRLQVENASYRGISALASGVQERVKKRAHHTFDETTQASAENRDAQGRPLPKPPRVPDPPLKSAPRVAWERMLARGRKQASAVSISSLLRFRKLTLSTPDMTAVREPVTQFKGLGLSIRLAGLVAWALLYWQFDLGGAATGAVVFGACYYIGRAKSKPWRCGNCKMPLTTAKVRVCPTCSARLVDLDAVKVIPWS